MDKITTNNLSIKRKKFREIAERRTNAALEAVRKIGNLSNRSLYEWNDAEVRAIIKALKAELAEVEGRFTSPGARGKGRFKL